MNTTHIRKKSVTAALGAAVAAAAAPTFLFAGTGTAQADTRVSTTTDALGVTVHIESVFTPGQVPVSNGYPSNGLCTYSAVPQPEPGKLAPLPVTDVPFTLQDYGTHDLWFPGVQTRSTWDVTVSCPVGGADHHTVIY
jgi:hypothetical protein